MSCNAIRPNALIELFCNFYHQLLEGNIFTISSACRISDSWPHHSDLGLALGLLLTVSAKHICFVNLSSPIIIRCPGLDVGLSFHPFPADASCVRRTVDVEPHGAARLLPKGTETTTTRRRGLRKKMRHTLFSIVVNSQSTDIFAHDLAYLSAESHVFVKNKHRYLRQWDYVSVALDA